MLLWTEEVILKFMQLYEQKDILWNPSNNRLSRRRSRAIAWSAIAKKMSAIYKESVTVIECKQKLRSVVQKFRREKLKILCGKGEEVISDWPLYASLSFLDNSTFLRLTSTNNAPIVQERKKTRTTTNVKLNDDSEPSVSMTSTRRTPICRAQRTEKRPATVESDTTDNDSNDFVTPAKRRRTEEVGRILRNRKTVELNTTGNEAHNITTLANKIELERTTKNPKRSKIVNVNIIQSPAPEVPHSPVTPISTALDPCRTPAQDECQNFGMFVINKMRTYSSCTRSAVQHAISDILFNADMGCYDHVNSSSTTNTQTQTRHSSFQQYPETTRLNNILKSEEISDLDDDSISHLRHLDRIYVQ